MYFYRECFKVGSVRSGAGGTIARAEPVASSDATLQCSYERVPCSAEHPVER